MRTGSVVDAHEGHPIARARVAIFSAHGQIAETTSDERGEFQLDPGAAPQDWQLRVEGTWHAPLERPLPPPGRLSIALITRRRSLLTDLVGWAKRRGPPFARDREATPGEVRSAAQESAEPGLARWATAVESAAFGPSPVDADREAEVRAREPHG